MPERHTGEGPRVKGTVIEARLAYVRKQGEVGWRRFVGALSSEARELAEAGALVNAWYSFALFVEISEAIDRLFGDGTGGMFRELGRESFDKYSGTLYRLVFRALTLDFLIRRAAVAWRLHYDQGEMSSTAPVRLEDGGREIVIRLEGLDVTHPAHCLAVRGWIVRAGEMTGATKISETCLECKRRGDARCTWSFKYH